MLVMLHIWISAMDLADITSALGYHDAIQRGIMVAGQFHNLVLNQMYFWGIPASLIFAIGWLASVVILFKQTCRATGSFGALCVGFMVLFIGVSGQLIVNGTGDNFLTLCILMGCVQAFSTRDDTGELVNENHPQHQDAIAEYPGVQEPAQGEVAL